MVAIGCARFVLIAVGKDFCARCGGMRLRVVGCEKNLFVRVDYLHLKNKDEVCLRTIYLLRNNRILALGMRTFRANQHNWHLHCKSKQIFRCNFINHMRIYTII